MSTLREILTGYAQIAKFLSGYLVGALGLVWASAIAGAFGVQAFGPYFGLLWFGFAVDFMSLVLVSMTILLRSRQVGLPIVGWLAYAGACIVNPLPILWRTPADAWRLPGVLLAKTAEFVVLTILHVTLQYLWPRHARRTHGRQSMNLRVIDGDLPGTQRHDACEGEVQIVRYNNKNHK